MTTTETERVTETAVEQATEEQEAKRLEIQAKFDEAEQILCKQEEIVHTLRAFFKKHRETIAPFFWRTYGWDPELKFETYRNNAKEVARAFGSEGWRREHDRYSCGSINWLKTIDGVTLKIENAESIKLKLIDEVKL